MALIWACAGQWSPLAAATETELSWGGHIKGQLGATAIPADSVFRPLVGPQLTDTAAEARLNLSVSGGRLDFQADYQLLWLNTERLLLPSGLAPGNAQFGGTVNDDRRWFNLTDKLHSGREQLAVQRLDRLNIGYTTARTAWRVGRQAISWGNGLIFTPMDVFNPFDPALVDKEYKPGDDMLYGQVLLRGGHDIQAVAVARRDPRGRESLREVGSLALKYHGFAGPFEYDLLAAEHYDETLLAIGGSLPVGEAMLSSDLSWFDTPGAGTWQAVLGASYSWTWREHNVSGLLEFYYNGFGQPGGAYSPRDLLGNPALLRRLERGELFTLARHYAATSLIFEMTPLLLLTPKLFINLDDPSALAQLAVQYSWRQNLQVLGAINLPLGPNGSEYGGIPATEALPGRRFFSTGPSAFLQLAWYY